MLRCQHDHPAETLLYIGVILLFFAALAGIGELLDRREQRLLRRRVRENRRRTRRLT